MDAGVDLPEQVRTTCARVVERARSVRIDAGRLESLAAALRGEGVPARVDDAQFTPFGDRDTDVAFGLVMNAVNFGSGWFPVVRKRPGMSGAVTMGANLRDAWVTRGPWSPRDLVDLDVETVAATFGQDAGGAAADLMVLFTHALRDLGALLCDRYDATYTGIVETARRSAVRMAALLTEMPLYRDVATHDGEPVAFYKRAQLTPAALAHAVGGFDDVDRLTIFADNLVPHVLRVEGVPAYDDALAARVDREELLDAGSPEEVEIRAAGVTACEDLATAAGTIPAHLDFVLWNRGQQPRYKAVPRHRARCAFY